MTTYQLVKYTLNIKVIDESVKEFYQNFKSHHNGDSGIDLFNFETPIANPFEVVKIGLNIKCEMINNETNELVSYYLVPRSSLSKTSFQLANSVGIIDAGYRGEIMCAIRCLNNTPSMLNEGSYFQIVAPDLNPIQINIVDELSESTRVNGFGSTNKTIVDIV